MPRCLPNSFLFLNRYADPFGPITEEGPDSNGISTKPEGTEPWKDRYSRIPIAPRGEMGPRLSSFAVIVALLMVVPALCDHDNQPRSVTSSSSLLASSVPENFELTHSVKNYNQTGQLTFESEFYISSNGSAHYAQTYPGNANGYYDANASALLTQEYVDHLRDAMNNDSICSLNGTYNDARWHTLESGKSVDEITIKTPCGIRTLKFYGQAMVGILPCTYVEINKVEWHTWVPQLDVLNISLEVSARIGTDATASVSAVLRNNASHNFTFAGCSHDLWRAEIVRSNGCSIARVDYDVGTLCVFDVAPGDTFQFNTHIMNITGLAVGKYVVMASSAFWGVTTFNITQDLGHTNQAPQAYLLVSKPADSDNNIYEFDASESCDEEDLVTELQVRWDWYSDGVWDSDWSFEKTARYTFANMTGYNLTIEVMDSSGLVAGASTGMIESHSTWFSPLNAMLLATLTIVVAVALLLFFRRKR